MRLLLPPSEGKQPGGRGAPLDPDRYGAGPLGDHRRRLCALVEQIANGPRRTAIAALQLPPAVADDALAANRVVSRSGTRVALERYAGVVYDGLAYASMPVAQRRVANRSVLVFSGLFGVVGATERLPDYRVPAAAMLAPLGSAGASWRPLLDELMPDRLGRAGIVVDLRSTDYAAMWRPPAGLAARVVTVRVLSRRPDGTLGVISYFSKHAKGRLAGALIAEVAAGGRVRDAEDVARIWSDHEGGDALVAVAKGRVQVDLVTRPQTMIEEVRR